MAFENCSTNSLDCLDSFGLSLLYTPIVAFKMVQIIASSHESFVKISRNIQISHMIAPSTRSASVSEMPPLKSSSKPTSSKGLKFLKVRLNKHRSSDSQETVRPPTCSASPLRHHETTASIDAQFVDNLLQGGKHVPRFTKRMPSIRTAVKKYESMTFRQKFMGLPEEVRNKIYDYVIVRDTPDESIRSPLEHCGAGFVDCSRGIITLDAGDHADILYLSEVRFFHSYI